MFMVIFARDQFSWMKKGKKFDTYWYIVYSIENTTQNSSSNVAMSICGRKGRCFTLPKQDTSPDTGVHVQAEEVV